MTNSAIPADGSSDSGASATAADDFLDSGLYAGVPSGADVPSGAEAPSGADVPSGGEVAGDGDGGRGGGLTANRWKSAVRPTAWLAAGVVIGAVTVAAWHSSQTTTPLASPAAAQGQLPGGGQAPGGGQPPDGAQAPNGQGPNGQAPNGAPGFGGPGGPRAPGGPGAGRPGFGAAGPGGRAGEQHLNGTVSTVGSSSVTVRLANGSTATYGVIASSDIVKNGARVSLSAIKPGDAVFLHVYPVNGHLVVEHLFAGPPPASPGEAGTTNT